MSVKTYSIEQLRGAFGAGKASAKKEPPVGMFCHQLSDRRIERQGFIKGIVDDGFLVQWFSWIDGRPTVANVVAVDVVAEFVFYEDEASWRRAYEKESAR